MLSEDGNPGVVVERVCFGDLPGSGARGQITRWKMKQKLEIDLDQLDLALQTACYEMRYYLDLETGEILLVPEEYLSGVKRIYRKRYERFQEARESGEEVREVPVEEDLKKEALRGSEEEMLLLAHRLLQDDGERYLSIEGQDSREAYREMERFIPTVDDPELRERLWRAIDGRGAFRYFKDVLLDHLDVREDWFAFKEVQNQRRLERWLEAHDIEPV